MHSMKVNFTQQSFFNSLFILVFLQLGIAQNITLTLQDMLAMTDQNHDLFINIDNGEGDTLNLLGYDLSNMSYTQNTINGVLYNIYQIDGVTLYLNTDNT